MAMMTHQWLGGVGVDLFSATQPTLNNCAGVTIGCWSGAYAGLSQHFQAANLDPHSNNWDKVRCPHHSYVQSTPKMLCSSASLMPQKQNRCSARSWELCVEPLGCKEG